MRRGRLPRPGISPQIRIFAGSKAPRCEISDDLARFEELPG